MVGYTYVTSVLVSVTIRVLLRVTFLALLHHQHHTSREREIVARGLVLIMYINCT